MSARIRGMNYESIAKDVVNKAVRLGADQCDAFIETGSQLEITVRRGELETVQRAGFAGLGIRFFTKKRLGFSFATDLSNEAIDRAIEQARAFSLTASPDPDAGIAESICTELEDLEIFDPKIDEIPIGKKISMALECEQAAYDFDQRITNTYGTTYKEESIKIIIATNNHDPISYRATTIELACIPVAESNGQKRIGMWLSKERLFNKIEPPDVIGRTSAANAIRMLGAKPVKTQKAPVIFDQRTAGEVFESIFDCLDGSMVIKGMSFLKDRIGQKVASEHVTIIDDGRLPSRTGSRPFDADGIATQRTVCVEKGTLKQFLYDVRTARKAGTNSTGNARRGFDTIPAVGPNNFYLLPGDLVLEEIIGSVSNGIMITNLLGFGVNPATGDFSRGAEGLWIRNGEIVHPVDGITIASNLLDMLKGISAVGSDLRFFGRIGSPTILIEQMTIAGE